jgi:putative transcriptional regulator
MPLDERELLERDAKRNIGEELLEAIRDVKAGRYGAVYTVEPNEIVTARIKCGLSQSQFAKALHISARTLQQWEQGRRQPSGAAKTLLKIVAKHPEVLREELTSGA